MQFHGVHHLMGRTQDLPEDLRTFSENSIEDAEIEISGDRILELSKVFDIMIHTIKPRWIKLNKQKTLTKEKRFLFLDDLGGRCRQR